MKTLNKLFLFILLTSLSLVSCNQNEFDVPPVDVPHYEGAPANMTIKALKAAHTAAIGSKSADLIPDKSNIIISGIITGNDKSGNIYKKIVIQDETGAIDIAVNQTGLYTTYAVGQKVFLNCDGLYIGGYGAQAQIGDLYNGGIGQMAQSTFESKIHLDGLPVKENLPVAKELTFADLTKAGFEDLKGTLVTFKGVHFEKTGDVAKDVFASGSTNDEMSRNIILSTGEKLLIRTSSYASFAKTALPKGTGDITVILGKFNDTWQLTLRSVSDLIDFKGEDPIAPVAPIVPDKLSSNTKETAYTVEQTLANNGKMGWVKGYIVGAVGSGKISDASKFVGPFTKLTGNVIIASSPTENDYTKCIAVKLPAGEVQDGVNLDNNPSNLGKSVLVYGSLETAYGGATGITDTEACIIDNKMIGIEPIDITKCIFAETLIAGNGRFVVEKIAGDDVTSWSSDGKAKYIKASGTITVNKVKTNTVSESWLISPAISLKGKSTAALTFIHTINYAVTDAVRTSNCQVMISTDYKSGSKNSGTWEVLPGVIYPTADSWILSSAGNISLDKFAGKEIHIAFKYNSTVTECPIWEVKNFVVK